MKLKTASNTCYETTVDCDVYEPNIDTGRLSSVAGKTNSVGARDSDEADHRLTGRRGTRTKFVTQVTDTGRPLLRLLVYDRLNVF